MVEGNKDSISVKCKDPTQRNTFLAFCISYLKNSPDIVITYLDPLQNPKTLKLPVERLYTNEKIWLDFH